MKNILVTGGTGLLAHTWLLIYNLFWIWVSINYTSLTSAIFVRATLKFWPWLFASDWPTKSRACSRINSAVQPTTDITLAAFASVGDSFGQAAHVINNNSNIQLYILDAVAEIVPGARIPSLWDLLKSMVFPKLANCQSLKIILFGGKSLRGVEGDAKICLVSAMSTVIT